MNSSKENEVLVKTDLGLYSVESVENRTNRSPRLKWQKLLANDDPLYEIINCKINEKAEKGKSQQTLSPCSEMKCIRDNDRNQKIEEESVKTEREHIRSKDKDECPEQSFHGGLMELSSEKVQKCNQLRLECLTDTEAVVVMYCNNDGLHQLLQRIGITEVDEKINDMKNMDKYFIFGLKDKQIFENLGRRNSDTPRPKSLFKATDGPAHVYGRNFFRFGGEKTERGRNSQSNVQSSLNIYNGRRYLDGDELITYIIDYLKSSNSVSEKSENEFSKKEECSSDVSLISHKPYLPSCLEMHQGVQKTQRRDINQIPRHVSRDVIKHRQMQNSSLSNNIDEEYAVRGNSVFNNRVRTELDLILKDDLNFVQKPGKMKTELDLKLEDSFNFVQKPGTGDMIEFGSNIYESRRKEEYVPSFFCKGKHRRRRKNTITFEEYKKTKANKDFVGNAEKISEHAANATSETEITNNLQKSENTDKRGYLPSFLQSHSQLSNNCYGRLEEKERRIQQILKCQVHPSKSNTESNDGGIHSKKYGRTIEKHSSTGRKFDNTEPSTSLSSEILTSNKTAAYRQDYHRGMLQKSDFSESHHEECRKSSESFTDYTINIKRIRKKTYGKNEVSTVDDEERTPSAQYQTACEDLEIQYWNNETQVIIPSEHFEKTTMMQPHEKGENTSGTIYSKCEKGTLEESSGDLEKQTQEAGSEILSPKQGEKEASPFKGYPSDDLLPSLESIYVPLLSSNQFDNVTDDQDGDIIIGSGAYGSCYLATSRTLNREVIMKEFQSGIANHDIIHEARVLIYLYDTGYVPECIGIMYPGTITSFESTLILVQEYYGQGVTLKDLLNKIPKCKEPTNRGWLSIVHQLVAGLDFIHRKHVLLNDIKTDNILVDIRRGTFPIRYIDMGNATYRKGYVYPCSKEYLKAYYYLAPEVRNRQPSTPASDIFSLGYLIHGINAKAKISDLEYVYIKCTENDPGNRPKLSELERLILCN